MCANCVSTAEAATAWVAVAAFIVKPPAHRMLARAGLAPDPDPVAHDVRTIAFLEALDLDPTAVLGADVVAQASSWTPASTWVPWRERFDRVKASSARPIGSHSLISAA